MQAWSNMLVCSIAKSTSQEDEGEFEDSDINDNTDQCNTSVLTSEAQGNWFEGLPLYYV